MRVRVRVRAWVRARACVCARAYLCVCVCVCALVKRIGKTCLSTNPQVSYVIFLTTYTSSMKFIDAGFPLPYDV